jgi:cytoskeletal protein CcmA (bactofilin family)
MKSIISGLVAFLLLGIFAQTAAASSVIRTGEAVSIGGDQLIEGDFYSAAGKLNISGEVAADTLAVAGQITINGSVGADATLFGGTVNVYGSIGDDLRVVAGEVTIAEPVMGDVMVIGGIVNILPTASISGDLILLAGQTIVEGSVGGDILGRSEDLRIDGAVAGNIDVTVTTLTLGEKANIEGSVKYISRTVATQALNASVAGDLVRNDPVFPENEVTITSAILPVLVLLFSILAWFLVSRPTLVKMTDRALQKSVRPFILGFATLIVAPFAIVILSASMIGLLVGMTLFFAYGLLLVASVIGSSAVIGQLMMKLFNQSSSKISLVTILVGVVGCCCQWLDH